MPRRPPVQKPGRSEQTVATPRDFLARVGDSFGGFDLDVCANADNAAAERYYSLDERGENALVLPWDGQHNWCNPPFADIAPWVQHAYEQSCQPGYTGQTTMLVPASVGSNWYLNWVYGKADVLFLNGRLKFVGHSNYYPKDLMLLIYANPEYMAQPTPHHCVYDWKQDRVYDIY